MYGETILALLIAPMKLSILVLFLFSIALAFAAGSLALQLQAKDQPAFGFSTSEINAVKRQFREKSAVIAELNTAELFPAEGGTELTDPRKIVVSNHRLDFARTATVQRAIELCRPELITNPELSKARKWIEFHCGHSAQLPKNFFLQPPYIFPLGSSFALLAYQSGRAEFASGPWLQEHISLFHALELSELPKSLELDLRRRILSGLSAETLMRIASGQEWVVGSSYVLVRLSQNSARVSSPSEVSGADYLAYARKDFDQLLSQKQIAMGASEQHCSYREDGLCWVSILKAGTVKIRWSAGLLLILTLGLISFCCLLITKTLRRQKIEEQSKRFALQSLTHELRTPLASLMLSSEQLMQQFESLPANAQESFLFMFDDVQRLVRVANSSQNYLRSGANSAVVPLNFELLPSVNEYVTAVLARYEDEISLELLDEDCSFSTDRYWLGVCLQNLVQNACQHGAKPVCVSVRGSTDRGRTVLTFAVTDAGEITQKNAAEFFKAFYKGSNSQGLGLGLSIVETVSKAMGGELEAHSNPTKFALLLEASK
jgi:signal transduction histidine kinase